MATINPAYVQIANGTVLKLVMPSNASNHRRRGLKVDFPVRRGSTTKSTVVCLYPTQANKPFIKRRRSGICLSASTTRLSIKRKSPTL